MSLVRTVGELKAKLEGFNDDQVIQVTMEDCEQMEDHDIADVLIGVYDACLISINHDRRMGKFDE